ncbi:uncharacterized protein LOC106071012 isoform X2 [Biomphalaria glabrata]|uniref:Uncharacterized protein LOC106071012 isoform X2 n=1 Tax=Biomphalaria glabrata TaxID=6526 RepID=A0A9W3AA87_BIOGL|nr:uncharacterized protein LOC106071012 isoform X2 [Biomphalaria glabrata]
MTLRLHGVFFSFTLFSLLLQVLGQTDNCPTVQHIYSGGNCFYVYLNEKSWDEAKVECERLNSSLAEFDSQEQAINIFVSYQSNFWIGVYDYKPEQSWVWISDNKTVNMSYWDESPEDLKNETCGYMYFYDDPKISVKNCASTLFYICMGLPVAPTTTTLTTEVPETTTTSTTEAPATTTSSTTERSTNNTITFTTEAPASTTTSRTEATATEETTSLSSQTSTYSSSQQPTTFLANTMSTITNTNSQMGNTLETTKECRGMKLKALPILLSLTLVIFVI